MRAERVDAEKLAESAEASIAGVLFSRPLLHPDFAKRTNLHKYMQECSSKVWTDQTDWVEVSRQVVIAAVTAHLDDNMEVQTGRTFYPMEAARELLAYDDDRTEALLALEGMSRKEFMDNAGTKNLQASRMSRLIIRQVLALIASGWESKKRTAMTANSDAGKRVVSALWAAIQEVLSDGKGLDQIVISTLPAFRPEARDLVPTANEMESEPVAESAAMTEEVAALDEQNEESLVLITSVDSSVAQSLDNSDQFESEPEKSPLDAEDRASGDTRAATSETKSFAESARWLAAQRTKLWPPKSFWMRGLFGLLGALVVFALVVGVINLAGSMSTPSATPSESQSVSPPGLDGTGWSPMRSVFTEENPPNEVVLNSITNNPDIGDERQFMGASESSDSPEYPRWQSVINVNPDREYIVRVYVNNDAPEGSNLVATNTRVMVNLPTTTGTELKVAAFVSADNANPKQVIYGMKFVSANVFNMAYVPGSARYFSAGQPRFGVNLDESLLTSAGVLVGYDKLDGNMLPSRKNGGYVTFRIRPQLAVKNDFTITHQVRKAGDTAWQDAITVDPGMPVEYLVTYRNAGDIQQDDVSMNVTLPDGISYINDKTKIANSTNPDGIKYEGGNSIFGNGINIGAYKGGAAAYVRYDAIVSANDKLPTCGANALASNARGGASPGWRNDSATVTVTKSC